MTDEPNLQPVSAAQFERYLGEPKQGSETDVDPVNEPSRAVLVASNISTIAAEREDLGAVLGRSEDGRGTAGNTVRRGWIRIGLGGCRGGSCHACARGDCGSNDQPGADSIWRIQRRQGWRQSVLVRFVELDQAAYVDWALGLGDRFGSARSERMIHYPKPRAGRVQEQFDAELPAECDQADVAAIVGGLAGDFDSLGVRYTIVVHVPDKSNDARNYHIHFVLYLGRCTPAGRKLEV